MAKTTSPPAPRRPSASVGNDIYTVLVCIALAFILGAIAFVIYRCTEILGTPFPGFAG